MWDPTCALKLWHTGSAPVSRIASMFSVPGPSCCREAAQLNMPARVVGFRLFQLFAGTDLLLSFGLGPDPDPQRLQDCRIRFFNDRGLHEGSSVSVAQASVWIPSAGTQAHTQRHDCVCVCPPRQRRKQCLGWAYAAEALLGLGSVIF